MMYFKKSEFMHSVSCSSACSLSVLLQMIKSSDRYRKRNSNFTGLDCKYLVCLFILNFNVSLNMMLSSAFVVKLTYLIHKNKCKYK